MAGPGGVERGRISIRVVPGTDGFARSLQRYLERIERSLVLEIPVQLDAGGIEGHARAATRDAQRAAGRVEIPVQLDRRANEQVTRDVQALSRNLAQRIRDISTVYSATAGPAADFARSTAKVALVAGAAATALVGATGLVGGLAAYTAAAVAAAGAAPLVVPGMASLFAVSSTLKVALSGVGDALDEALGKDAFKQISDQAKRFVGAVKDIAPTLLQVRNVIQNALFDRLSEQVRPLADRYLPTLGRAAVSIARVMNGSLRRALESVNNSTDQWRLAYVLDAAKRSLSAFSPVIERLPRLLLKVGEAAGPAFTRLADRLAGAVGRVFDRIEKSVGTGGIEKAIDGAVQVAVALGSTLASVLRTIRGIGEAASRAFGTDLTSPVAAAAKKLAELVESAPGQDFLTGLFTAAKPVLVELGGLLGDLAGAVGRVLPVAADLAEAFLKGLRPVVPVAERLATALGGALTSILPSLSEVAIVVGETLAGALEALGPSLPIIAGGLAAMASAVGGGLQQFFTALEPVLPRLAESFATLAGALGEGLAGGLAAIAPKLPSVADAFVALAGGLASITPDIISTLADAFVAIAPDLPDIATNLASIASSLAALSPALVPILDGIGAGLQVISTALNTPGAAGGPLLALLGLASGTGPSGGLTAGYGAALMVTIGEIGRALSSLSGLAAAAVGPFLAQLNNLPSLVLAALAGLVPTIMVNFGRVPPAILGALAGAGPAVLARLGVLPALAAAAVGSLPTLVSAAVRAVVPNLGAIWTAAVNGARGVLGGMPSAAAGAVGPLAGRVAAAIANLPAVIVGIATAAVAQLVAKLATAPGQAAAALAGLPAALVAAIASAAAAAGAAAAQIPGRIAAGITSNLGVIRNAAAAATGILGKYLPGSPVREGPLRVLNNGYAGGQIVKMIADGLVKESPTLRSAAQITAAILADNLGQVGGVDSAVRNISGAVAAAASARAATATPAPAGPAVHIDTVYTTDPEEFTRVLTRKQQDVAAVYSLASIAAVGG